MHAFELDLSSNGPWVQMGLDGPWANFLTPLCHFFHLYHGDNNDDCED